MQFNISSPQVVELIQQSTNEHNDVTIDDTTQASYPPVQTQYLTGKPNGAQARLMRNSAMDGTTQASYAPVQSQTLGGSNENLFSILAQAESFMPSAPAQADRVHTQRKAGTKPIFQVSPQPLVSWSVCTRPFLAVNLSATAIEVPQPGASPGR